MIGFLVEIGGLGLLIVLTFFIKLKSLPPLVRAAVVGIRVIFGLGVILVLLLVKYDNSLNGKDFFGNLQVDQEMMVGTWEVKFLLEDGENAYITTYSFYPDSAFYTTLNNNSKNSTGKWYYDPKKEVLNLQFPEEILHYKLISFKDETTLKSKSGYTFTKLNDVPEPKEKITAAIEEKKAEEEVKVELNQYKGIPLSGNWGLKSIESDGLIVRELGAYTLSEDGTGSFVEGIYGNGPISYFLDKAKKRLTISRNDKVYSIKVESFSVEEIVGHATGESDKKYVFVKAL